MKELMETLRNTDTHMSISPCKLGITVSFLYYNAEFIRHEDDRKLSYHVQELKNSEETYVRIVCAVVGEFVGVVEEAPVRRVAEPTVIMQRHETDICGLSKQEYIALELTKAWASTRCNGYEGLDEISDAYFNFITMVEDWENDNR